MIDHNQLFIFESETQNSIQSFATYIYKYSNIHTVAYERHTRTQFETEREQIAFRQLYSCVTRIGTASEDNAEAISIRAKTRKRKYFVQDADKQSARMPIAARRQRGKHHIEAQFNVSDG